MDKEEQIKRLAQNLFSSGFTKSMDHAIQTAANMLGFPDSMLVSKSTKESREEMGANTVTTGVSGMYNRDLAKRINQSIAEERVFSQVPNSVRSAFQSAPSNPVQSTQSTEMYSEQNEVNNQSSSNLDYTKDISVSNDELKSQTFNDDDLFVNNSNQDSSYQDSTTLSSSSRFPNESYNDEDLFSKNSYENDEANYRELVNETNDHDLYSSQPHIMDKNEPPELASSENFIESNHEVSESGMPEWNEEEQTSLISGFVETNEYSSNDALEDSSNLSLESAEGANTDVYEKAFKHDDSKNLDMVNDSMNYQINSRFETVLGGEEDFFTVSSSQNSEENHMKQNEEHRQESFESGAVVQSQQSAPSQQANVAEATVDLTQMFDFRNLKN